MVVGLTGGIGSGKTTIATLFDEFENVVIYNADFEAKKIMNSSSTIKSKIIQQFGEKSYLNNQLNSAYIASLVFNDKSKLELLTSLVHPEVRKHFQYFKNLHAQKEYILYENAILFESKSNLNCDIIISVFTPLDIRVKRTMLRDQSSRAAVEFRIKNQYSEKIKHLQSNYIIYNSTQEKVKSQIIRIHNILTKKPSVFD
ncbi:MAG: dephospho-CoA kinase [Polaribacter sp.]|jgi:dephospho-CoA kinase|nr:dephospho-CoA kinase [Polaribacter sp.]